jgi:hypothetical protein
VDVIEQKKSTQAEGTHSQADGESDIDAYSHAFNVIPKRYLASALELFLVQKGLTEGQSLSTTWGIFSAFKDMWKNACLIYFSLWYSPMLQDSTSLCIARARLIVVPITVPRTLA